VKMLVVKEAICYLQLETPQRVVDFRFDSAKAHAEWVGHLLKCGVVQQAPLTAKEREEREAAAAAKAASPKRKSLIGGLASLKA
jgi:hypothetical protein